MPEMGLPDRERRSRPRGDTPSDEQICRIAACPGGNHNLAAYVRQELQKSGMSNDLILRDDGTCVCVCVWGGALSVTVSIGV